MRIVFFGTASFAVPALEAVAQDTVLVVSQPDRPSGRGLSLHPSPVKARALELGLPVVTPEKARTLEFVDSIHDLDADFLLVAAYGQILSVALLESARHGGINLHGSILPEYRGAAPIQRCLLDGRTETGVTLIQMDKGMDSGDMIAIEKLSILPGETYGELQDRLAQLAGEMAKKWKTALFDGSYPRTPQDHALATFAPKIEKSEAILRWDSDAATEFNRFRAFTPAPGAVLPTKFGDARLSGLSVASGSGRPSEILAVSPGLVVAFSVGALRIDELQPSGKKRMTGRDFANGHRLKVGDSLAPEPTP